MPVLHGESILNGICGLYTEKIGKYCEVSGKYDICVLNECLHSFCKVFVHDTVGVRKRTIIIAKGFVRAAQPI